MNTKPTSNNNVRLTAPRLLDVLIRLGMLVALVVLCYRVFAPFLNLTVWAVILAVTIYPMQRRLAKAFGGKQGLAATLIVVVGIALIVTPTALLLNSFGDSVRYYAHGLENHTLEIPAPSANVAQWPIVGEKLHAVWSKAHADLPGLVASMQPKLGDTIKDALAMVARIGIGLMLFFGAFIVAGIVMAYGESGARASRDIFVRIVGAEKGERFVHLATATIRAVAFGVIGVAFIQAIVVGIVLLIAKVPAAGLAAIVTAILAIAQIPVLLVTLPAVAYIWMSGDYGTGAAIAYTVVLVLAGVIDNVLKPLMLGRGVDAPMPVILLGALGGMASGGILGMFVGATLLALGYQIFMAWVREGENGEAMSPTT